MSRGRLVVHGHFYQPRRADPFSGTVPPEPSAAPYPDWTSRIDAECYRPNAERGNFARISWDLGPTLASWLAEHDVVFAGNTLYGIDRTFGVLTPQPTVEVLAAGYAVQLHPTLLAQLNSPIEAGTWP